MDLFPLLQALSVVWFFMSLIWTVTRIGSLLAALERLDRPNKWHFIWMLASIHLTVIMGWLMISVTS